VNFESLETHLTLNELFLLYRACMNETNTAMKIAAAAQGAEVDFEEDWYDPEPPRVAQAHDILDMKFGMGYEVVKKSD
jgi:hypothetical protein